MFTRNWAAAAYVLVALATSFSQAADWPQWRGPNRDGISKEAGLLHQWPAEGPNLIWQLTDIGSGYSTPSIAAGRIFLLGNQGMDDEFVQARNEKDGVLIWSTHIGKVGNPDQQPPYPGARSTPTIDGQALYALGSDGDLACLQLSDGSMRWHKNLRSDFGGEPGVWAYSESPLIDGDTLVCTPGGKDATIVALNKKTGETIWKAALPDADQAAYASAIVTTIDGVKQYVQFVQKAVVGLDAKTGALLWSYGRTAKGSPANIPTPLADGKYIYTSTGMTGGGLVKIDKTADAEPKFDASQVYFAGNLPKAIGGVVKVDGYFYGANTQALQCVDFNTGDVKWTDRSIGPGSILYADGQLYLHGENGDVALVDAEPDAYHEKGRFTPPDAPDRSAAGLSMKAWAYPVLANGRLYVRDQNHLWCYDLKAK
ncbi:MAG TPA: PQQ-binding-like beta-propeller repeat protein [Pirellulales bacterium]|jgi:outer membrane protein assembly factor BamB